MRTNEAEVRDRWALRAVVTSLQPQTHSIPITNNKLTLYYFIAVDHTF
jgi:hypothetical protein